MLKSQLPFGIRDEFGQNAQVEQQLETTIIDSFEQRGFQKIATPMLENARVFEDYQMANQKMYRLLTEDGSTLVLRPDLTLPIARFLSSTNIQLPQKFYYVGERFRVNRRLSGSNNQQTQAGMELVGYPSIKAEQECLQVILNLGQQLNLTLRLELGVATFVPTVLQAVTADQQLRAAISDALYNKKIPAYEKLIAQFKQSEFFAFLQVWPRLFGSPSKVFQQLKQTGLPESLLTGLKPLAQLDSWLKRLAPQVPLTVDLSSQAPQAYYTGLTFQASSNAGAAVLFSGGRYDQLLANFQEQLEPAVGMGIDLAALTTLKLKTFEQRPRQLIYFAADQWQQAEQLLQQLPNGYLSLADDLQTAQAEANAKGWQLIDLTKEVAE